MSQQDKRDELLTAPYTHLIVKLCLPAIVGMVVIALYSFMDSIYAGQMISKEAMAAIGIAYPFTLLNNSISVLFGMGGASLLSRVIGAQDREKQRKILPTVSYWVIGTSLVVTIFGFFFAGQLIHLTAATGEIFTAATEYLRIIFLGSIFVNLTQALNMLIRAEGRMVQAMSIMGIGALLNIILDPLFIWLFPGLGVQAVALATLISQLLQAVLTYLYFQHLSPQIGWARPQLHPGLSRLIIPVGISGMMMQFATMIQQTLLYRTASHYGGSDFQIILSALLRIQMFAFIPLWGASQGFQPFVGTNFGAQRYERLYRGRRAFMIFAFLLSLFFFLPMQIVPDRILSWFIQDETLILAGISPARKIFSTFFLYGFMALLGIYFQALGDAKTAGLVVVGRNLILFIPAVLLLPALAGPAALWWVFAVCDLVAVSYAFYKYAVHGRLLLKKK